MCTIGAWIRTQLDRLGWSQAQLADMLGVHQTTVSSWVRGRTDLGRVDVVAILDVFGVPEAEWPEVMRLPVQAEDEQLEGAA